MDPLEFHEIISERKGEIKRKAVQKRLQDLKSIQDQINSMSSMLPFSLTRVPKEVWLLILAQLDDPNDLATMSDVHPLFFDLLEESRTRDILLPQVISLGKLPLPLSSMRQISKKSKAAVDRYCEEKLSDAIEFCNDDYIASLNLESSDLEEISRISEEVTSTRTRIRTTAPCRFFSRSLQIHMYMPDEEDGDDYMEQLEMKISALLDVIGSQIWHFAFKIDLDNAFEFEEDQDQSFDRDREEHQFRRFLMETMTSFRKFLDLMPNIKWLDIDISTETCPQRIEKIKESCFLELQKLHPLPHLRHLEKLSLSFNSCKTQGIHLLEALLRVNTHIRILELKPKADTFSESLNTVEEMTPAFQLLQDLTSSSTSSLTLPNLEVFHFGVSDMEMNACDARTTSLELILPIINPNWKLRNLHIWFDASSSKFSLANVFNFVNGFPTLEHLTLRMKDVDVNVDIPYLRLPNLQNLELSFSEKNLKINYSSSNERNLIFFHSLQFLVHSKELKSLIWGNHSWPKWGLQLGYFLINHDLNHPENSIGFCGGFKNLKDSNIWNVFPELESVQIHSKRMDRGFIKTHKGGTSTLRRGPTFEWRNYEGRYNVIGTSMLGYSWPSLNYAEYRRSDIEEPKYTYHCLHCQCGLYSECGENNKHVIKDGGLFRIDPGRVRKLK